MTTRIFGHALLCAGVVALLALLLPSAAWAHRCGPQTLKVKKGDTVSYALTGSDVIEHHIFDKGDPLVAKIEPPMNDDVNQPVFNIVGVGNGVTIFKINWEGEKRRYTCRVEVTVAE